MQIILSPMGTEGDIRPFVALGIALQKLGNAILMVVPANARDLCEKYNLPYQTIDYDYKVLVSQVAKKPSLKELTLLLDAEISAQFTGVKAAARDADFLIGGARNYAVPTIAELYGIAYYQVWHTVQIFKSRQYPPWRVSRQNNPVWLNRLLWKLSEFRDNSIGDKYINKHRVEYGLKPLSEFASAFRKNILLVADKNLVAVPSDVTENYLQTDYWQLQEDQELDPELVAFINEGKPVIYMGFGSMPDKSGEQTVAVLEDVVQSLKIRAVIQKGWAGLAKLSANTRIKLVDAIPHEKLFPLMAAVIHHGGAGTTHMAAFSGVPQIIVPQMLDQFFWGTQIYRLGLGPQPILKQQLNAQNLKVAISRALNETNLNENAQRMREKLRQSDNMETIAQRLQQEMRAKIQR